MHLQNLHTMEELHLTGNCLKGSRPILSFDAAFDSQAHLRVIKELFLHTFGVPQGARKSKPFIDHLWASASPTVKFGYETIKSARKKPRWCCRVMMTKARNQRAVRLAELATPKSSSLKLVLDLCAHPSSSKKVLLADQSSMKTGNPIRPINSDLIFARPRLPGTMPE